MKIKKFWHQLSLKTTNIPGFLVWFVPVAIALFDFLFKWGVISFIYLWVKVALNWVWKSLSAAPLLTLLILSLFAFALQLRKRLLIVAGEFKDDFKEGLYNWEFGGEGWKIEHDGGEPVLSVSESQDGGITKKGFGWSDYEFSFETKVIKDASGWIVRAENRNKYFMIQLTTQNPDDPRLRPHYRFSDQEYPWIALEDRSVSLRKVLETKIKNMAWIRVKIAIRGSTVDVFMNNEHALHFFLDDPARFEKGRKVPTDEGEVTLGRELIALSYPTGRIGFRCAPGEHAHFRNVRVKPL